jgi:hypothetical protein
MIYNQPNTSNGIPMPLLMAYMTATAIQEADPAEPVTYYDPVSQTVRYDARIIGTYSLKISSTKKRREPLLRTGKMQLTIQRLRNNNSTVAE